MLYALYNVTTPVKFRKEEAETIGLQVIDVFSCSLDILWKCSPSQTSLSWSGG